VEDGVPPPRAAPALLRRVVLSKPLCRARRARDVFAHGVHDRMTTSYHGGHAWIVAG
jgi:hypothetical protein